MPELLVTFAVAMTTAPSVNSHELVGHPAILLSGGRAVSPSVLLRDLLASWQRQPLNQPEHTAVPKTGFRFREFRHETATEYRTKHPLET